LKKLINTEITGTYGKCKMTTGKHYADKHQNNAESSEQSQIMSYKKSAAKPANKSEVPKPLIKTRNTTV